MDLNRIRKDFRDLAGTDGFEQRLEFLETSNRLILQELKTLKNSVEEIRRKTLGVTAASAKHQPIQLITLIEEYVRDAPGPVRVVDVREALLQDTRVQSSAGNFYSVIATAMKNSPNFKKVSPGVFEYLAAESAEPDQTTPAVESEPQ